MIMQAKRFDEKANQERISSCPMAPPANQWGPSMPCRGYRERESDLGSAQAPLYPRTPADQPWTPTTYGSQGPKVRRLM